MRALTILNGYVELVIRETQTIIVQIILHWFWNFFISFGSKVSISTICTAMNIHSWSTLIIINITNLCLIIITVKIGLYTLT